LAIFAMMSLPQTQKSGVPRNASRVETHSLNVLLSKSH
jgi:hypothetical protein